MVWLFVFPIVSWQLPWITNRLPELSTSFITLPFLDRDPKAIEIVQVILESVLLRREKNMRDSDGNRIVELPAKEVNGLSIMRELTC